MKSNPAFRFGMATLLALLAAGCGSYPRGWTKSRWEALPPDEKALYRSRDSKQALRDGRATERQVTDSIKKAEAAHEVFPLDRAHLSAR